MAIFLFLGILLSILTFYIRIKPRIRQKDFGIDSWYYLLYTDELRKTRKIPIKLPYFLLDIDEQWYPPALPTLLMFFSQGFLEKFHWAIAAFIDAIQMIVLYWVSYLLTKNLWVASFAALLYATSPILVTQNSNLNSRGLGSFVLTSTMLSLCKYISSTNFLYLILIILLGTILLHTHKLASQQMLFLFVGFSFFYLNPIHILILIVIYLTAFILSGGFYLKVLKGHMGILKFWRKNLLNLFAHQIYQSPIYANQEKAKTKRGCGGIAVNKNWHILVKLQFIFIFAIISTYAFFNRKSLKPYDIFFLNWFLVNFFSIVIISYFNPLKFMGEGYRYFMYGIFPTSFLLSKFIFLNLHIGIFILFFLLFTNFLLINKIHQEQRKNILATLDSDLYEIIEQIKDLPRDNIMSFPTSYCEPIAYFCRKKTLWGAHSNGYEKLQSFFPVLLNPVEYFIQNYNISYCLINKEFVSLEDLYLSVNYKMLLERGRYCLLEFFK